MYDRINSDTTYHEAMSEIFKLMDKGESNWIPSELKRLADTAVVVAPSVPLNCPLFEL